MSRLSKWRLLLAMAAVFGYAACITESSSAQAPLPPRPIVPQLSNGSIMVNASPNAINLGKFGLPVFNFIASAPLEMRLMKNGTMIPTDRLIPTMAPGTNIAISIPAGQLNIFGPQPIIQQVIFGWGANRGNYPGMSGASPYWGYNYPSHNPFTSYSGFFPQQDYSASSGHSDLYALYNLANAYNFQQSQMSPYFGSFSSTSMSSSSSSSSATEANPFAAFDAAKDKKPEEPKEEK